MVLYACFYGAPSHVTLIPRRRDCIILLDEINASLNMCSDKLAEQVVKKE